jgi:O-antigen/teichoic acid export membrane protein
VLRTLFKLGRQSFLYILGDVVTQILALILIPIYTRALPPAEYGLLGIVSTVQKVTIPLLGLGVAGALTRFYFDSTDEQKRKRTAGAIWLGWIALASLMLVLINLVGPSLSKILFQSIPFQPYIQLGIGIAALNALATIPRALLRAQERPGWFSSLSVVNFTANALLIIYFVVYQRQGAVGSLRGQLLGNMLAGSLYVILMAVSVHWTWDTPTLKAALAFGLPLVPHLLASWALNFSDRWVLEHFVPLSDIGRYTLAYQFGLAMGMVLTSINRAWSPFFYRRIQEPDGPSLIPRIITYYVLSLAWIGLAVALLARPTIFLMADEPYHTAYRLVPPIVAGYAMLGLYFIPSNAILFAKRTRRLPLITGTAAAANIALNLVLVPRLGATAAALNTFLGYTILLLLALLIAQRVFPLAYEYRRILVSLGAALVCFALGTALLSTNAWAELLLRGLWTAIGYPALLLLAGFFTPRELRNARTLGRRVLERVWGRTGKNS